MMPILRASIVVALALALGGCAYEAETVAFAYAPSTSGQAADARAVPIALAIVDARERRDRFSSKTDAYGREHAPISATESVPDIVKSALAAELTKRGYKLGDGGTRVQVTIRRFYTRFTDHHDQLFKQDTADATVLLDIEVASRGGKVFTNAYAGEAHARAPTQLHWGGTAANVLSTALQETLTRMVDDSAFREAVAH